MIITINTDAGYDARTKLGYYAIWIKSDDFHYKGAGVFKNKIKGPTQAEFYAVANSISILTQISHDFDLLIVNRDNISVTNKGGYPLARELNKYISKYRTTLNEKYGVKERKIEFRHVKAHTGENDKRSYVNEWCDKSCREAFREHMLNKGVDILSEEYINEKY